MFPSSPPPFNRANSLVEEPELPGKYKLDDEISRNGPIRIVRAHDKENDYIIKIFDDTGVSKQVREKFLYELEFYKGCRDTRLVQILDVITMKNLTYIIYNEPMGGDLEALMDRNGDTFSESFVKNVASSILDTLTFLHLNDLTHGHCLPRNIFFPLHPGIPGWLQHVQLSNVYCGLVPPQLSSYSDLRDVAFMLCALMKRNIAVFKREDFAPVALKSSKWTHLSPDFIDFIEQLWNADKTERSPEYFLEHHWLVIVKPLALTESAIITDEEVEEDPISTKSAWLMFKLNTNKSAGIVSTGRKWIRAHGHVTASTIVISADESGLTGPESHAMPLGWNLEHCEIVVTLSKYPLTFSLKNKVSNVILVWLRFESGPDHDAFKSCITDCTDPDKVKRTVRKVEMKSKKGKKKAKEDKTVRGKSFKGPKEEPEEVKFQRYSALIRAQSLAYCHKTQSQTSKPKQNSLAPYPSDIRTRIHPGQMWDKRAKQLQLVMATNVPLNHEVRDGDHWFVIDASWFKQWFKFVTSKRRMVPPGPIDNLWMVSSKFNLPIEGLREDKDNDEGDYRRVTPQVWALFEEWYGGGPAISFVGPPSHNIRRWVVHFDGVVGNQYDAESDDDSENSEEAMVHIDAAKATPEEMFKLAEITRF